jgi:phosphoglucosamine mutase
MWGAGDGMTRRLFGTDGVRGTANQWPMTAEMALRIGEAAGRYFRNDGSNGHRVVIARIPAFRAT